MSGGIGLRAAPTQQVPILFSSGAYTVLGAAQPSSAAKNMTQSVLWAYPFYLPYAVAFDRIGVNVQATVASSNVRLGFYAAGASGAPGALLLDAGVVDTHTSTGFVEATISISFTPGLYWVAWVSQGGTATLYASNRDGMPHSSGATVTQFPIGGISASAACTGALPDPFGTIADGIVNPARIAVRAV